MINIEDSAAATPARRRVPTLYPPAILNEFIKCVVVGDSGVGKTCLITAWACDTDYTLDRLVKTHVSTVWAHDHYRCDPDVLDGNPRWNCWKSLFQILEGSVVELDGGCVALRLWDTFGYHDKDRGFAYKGADVVLLCFNVGMRKSLQNLRKIWIPEIRRKSPATPIVVCGCQADLRYLYRDEAYMKIHKGLMYRVIQEEDLVTPDQGRAVAKEISAPYYESSIFTKYGVNDVFLNVIRAAMVEKRKIRFWSAYLRRIKYPLIQAPMKLPPLTLPKIEVPAETLQNDLCKLLYNQSEGDVVFVAQGRCFRVHKICLVVSAKVFQDLFLQMGRIQTMDNMGEASNLHAGRLQTVDKMGEASHLHALFSSQGNIPVISSDFTAFDVVDPAVVSTGHEYRTTNHHQMVLLDNNPIPMHVAFVNIEENKVCENPFKPGCFVKQTVVTLHPDITARAFEYIIDYLYTGVAKPGVDCIQEMKVACQLLQLPDLAVILSNFKSGEEFLNVELDKHFAEQRKRNLRVIALQQEQLADIQFEVDDGVVSAHKPLLIARCEMMYAMFNDNFMEASADKIQLPGISRDVFLALREFLYTGDCPAYATLNCLGIIEVANRLCLPRLVRLVESRVVEDLTQEDMHGEDILEDVLTLLQPAQLHNADMLSDWCLKYLCNHYMSLRQRYSKMFHMLNADNIKAIEKNRWPPEWYVKELAHYEESQRASQGSKKSKSKKGASSGGAAASQQTTNIIQQKHQFSRWEQCTSAAGCLCFCRRSRFTLDDMDIEDAPK